MTRVADKRRIAQLEAELGYELTVEDTEPPADDLLDRFFASCALALVLGVLATIAVSTAYGDVPSAPLHFALPVWLLIGYAVGAPLLSMVAIVVWGLGSATFGKETT